MSLKEIKSEVLNEYEFNEYMQCINIGKFERCDLIAICLHIASMDQSYPDQIIYNEFDYTYFVFNIDNELIELFNDYYELIDIPDKYFIVFEYDSGFIGYSTITENQLNELIEKSENENELNGEIN